MLVDPDQPLYYHIVSRCVRRAWLCGKHGQIDHSHRKRWLIERFKQLSKCFAIDVHSYAIMSNHFHLVVYYDPTAAALWSDEDVVERWLQACPIRDKRGEIDPEPMAIKRAVLLGQPKEIERLRASLGSLSVFMKLLKQPVARRANMEDKCTGHFFEQRFYSAALLDEKAILAAMAYVDLNPIRAKLARTLEQIEHSSAAERLRSGALHLPMAPIVSGLIKPRLKLKIMLSDYIAQLNWLIDGFQNAESQDESVARWRRNVMTLQKRQRAFGSESLLKSWVEIRGLQLREAPMS